MKRFIKKLSMILACLAAVCIMASCEHTHSYGEWTVVKEPTYSEPGEKTCSCTICGESYTETIEKLKGDWEIDNYVDQFGDKTDGQFARGTFTGTYSNTATTGAPLTALIFLEVGNKTTTKIRLLEHDSHIPTLVNSIAQNLYIEIKDDTGKIEGYGLIYVDGDMYSFEPSLRSTIEKSKEASVVISSYSMYSPTYKFKINNLGLSELLSQ